MTKIIQRKRIIHGNYFECKECGHVEKTPDTITSMPYCGICGKIVFDACQKYYAWYGEKFEEDEEE